jgi:hypothetical protein
MLMDLCVIIKGTGLNSIDILTCCKCIHESIEEYFKTTPTTLVHLSFITIDEEHIHKAKQFFDNNHANSTPVAQASAPFASTTNKDDEDDNCVICMDKLDKERTRLDKCGHVFCSHCINEYFQKSKKQCPCCGQLGLFLRIFLFLTMQYNQIFSTQQAHFMG